MALSNKQRAFIEHYLSCFNASEAARRAGYSAKTAREIGYENLKKPDIAAAIKNRLADLHMTADEVLKRLTEQARGSMADFLVIKKARNGKASFEIDLAAAQKGDKLHLVKKVTKTTGRVKSTGIELYDAQSALTLIGKHLGLFVERTEHTGAGGGPIKTEAAQVTLYLPDNGRGDAQSPAGGDRGDDDH